MAELQQLAKNMTQKFDSMLVLLVNEKDNNLQVVCARSKDIDINMKELIMRILPKINGKGGGSETIAQGGGDKILSPEALIEKIIEAIGAPPNV